ncbi:MAG: tRNA (adenosine(37)-N6)-dimethylallyltransferase MiaA [Thermodesulfobacteriaceae bacterium]|nr:tRNA (adenosine(37)-N6)-dimethylallyltransferase MiaA [Thermodesulfobacteriaceae bacterium]MCX8041490.1 tRNA (adenosine(37)-N6)-dimethylallyltransferase MiaA [Thermodesulfobacteriaceae bacterium]MDW8135960.1 tRNA (adenosine(37)-N6)-dimethylallyltransferase MiaA [Thermodesulfobacterium sp.]
MKSSSKPKLLAVVGPTGSGKSELALFLAENLSGEIVNFDSLQVYQELNIGTAKPSKEDMERVPHHLYDFLKLEEEINAAKFIQMADKVIKEIVERDKVPILVGGTGLYLRALEYGLFTLEIPLEIRERVKKRCEENLKEAYEELKKLDPCYAQKISSKDKVRISRALEVIYTTSKPFSSFHDENPFFKKEKRYEILKIGLKLPRKKLYEKINNRVIKMIKDGWIEEVRALLDKGYSPLLKPLKAIGYKHLISYLKGEISLERAISLIQRDTRHYAKRQITWFKKELDLIWFSPEEKEKILLLVKSWLEN